MRIPEATQQFTLLYPRCWLGVKSKLSAAKIPRSPPARIRWACELIEFDTRIQAFLGEKLGTWIQRCSSSLSISVASLQCRSCRPLKWFIFSDAASERKGVQWWQHCPLKLSWVDQLWFRLKALQGLPPQGCCSGSWVVTDHSLLLRDLASLTSKKPGLSARPAKQAFHLGVKLRSKPDPSNVKSYTFLFQF